MEWFRKEDQQQAFAVRQDDILRHQALVGDILTPTLQQVPPDLHIRSSLVEQRFNGVQGSRGYA